MTATENFVVFWPMDGFGSEKREIHMREIKSLSKLTQSGESGLHAFIIEA